MVHNNTLDEITRFYLDSNDFNGLPLRELLASGGEEKRQHLVQLIQDGLVAVVFGDGHSNPHIRALSEHHPPERQVEMLDSALAEHACAYPLPKHLKKIVDRSQYADRPYVLALALGEPQLTHRAFDMAILETYRNDPRYMYETDDIRGTISVWSEDRESARLEERHRVILQSFGFAYDEDQNKYVAVFLRYLARLSPEHQHLWKLREIGKTTKLHPDYFRASLFGHWPDHGSIFEAVVEELRLVNRMTIAMHRPPLFREDFSSVGRPRDFSSLIRPTAVEFDNFVKLLDKMLADNIDKRFFRQEVPDEEEVERTDGKIEVRAIGTLRMLEMWLAKYYHTKESAALKSMFATFRKVRRLRSKPSHNITADAFDQRFIHDQRKLMEEAYSALRTLRLIFGDHPTAKQVEIPEWLSKGNIWIA